MSKTAARIILALMLVLPTTALAEGKTREQLALEIVSKMKTDDQFDEMLESIVSMQQQILKQGDAGENDAKMDALVKELNTTLKAEFSKTMKQDMATAYASVFTAEELQGLLDFYDSPIGKKYVEKTPELTKKSTELQQKTFAKMWPKIEEILKKYMGPGVQ